MKASVLREIAINAIGTDIIESIDSQLLDAANKGLTRLTISVVSQGVIAYLEDEGYKTEEITINGTFSQVVISW